MRAVINISLPKQMSSLVEDQVRSGQFSSKSEFFRHLIRLWQENNLLKELEESRKEFESGQGKLLRSLKDLR